MSGTVFVNVDTLNDFMNKYGNLYIPGAEEIIPALQKVTELARKTGDKIIHVADCHTEQSKEISDNPDYKTTYPSHCIKNTIGATFIKETAPINPYILNVGQREFDLPSIARCQEIVIRKDDVNVFTNRNATTLFKVLEPDKIYVYGVVTEICVDRVVVGLMSRGYYNVCVITDAIKELPGTDKAKVLTNWQVLGVQLITSSELIGA